MTPMDNNSIGTSPDLTLGLLGFGEAGTAFCLGWTRDIPEVRVSAYDKKTISQDKPVSAGKWQDYAKAEVQGCETPGEALGNATAVFSLVTADQAYNAACTAAPVMASGSFFFDCNSCAPDTKRASAKVIEAAGHLYVDAAVMSPVHPKLHQTPILISGPHVEQAKTMLDALVMRAEVAPGDVGHASSIKMMRSVMIKGLEALVLECVLSARKAGVDTEVLASLDATFPGFDWPGKAAYMMERTTTHGIRRAAEMREVAKTVTDLGLSGDMSLAIAHWQQAMGALGLGSGLTEYGARADAILAAMETVGKKGDDAKGI